MNSSLHVWHILWIPNPLWRSPHRLLGLYTDTPRWSTSLEEQFGKLLQPLDAPELRDAIPMQIQCLPGPWGWRIPGGTLHTGMVGWRVARDLQKSWYHMGFHAFPSQILPQPCLNGREIWTTKPVIYRRIMLNQPWFMLMGWVLGSYK